MKQYPVQKVAIKNGETIAWRQAGGKGPIVLLIHGNMSSSVHWQTTMEQLESAYRVYAVDLRGFGDSTYNAPFDTLRELSVDVAQFVDAVGLDRFAVAGWSTGGGVALELAADLPARVTGVTLVESVPLTGYPFYKRDASGKLTTERLKTKEDFVSEPFQFAPALAAYAAGNKEFFRTACNAGIYNLHQPSPEDYELYLEAILKQRNLIDTEYALLTFNMTKTPTESAAGSGRADLVKCPITVMQGEKDLVVPFAWGKTIKDYYGDRAEFAVFPETGHSVFTDDLPLFIAKLRESLSRG
jgi:pimeloyl-ACP methyl ester carboxylesterase